MQTGLQSDVFLVRVTALWSAEQKGFLLVLFSDGLSYQLTLVHAAFLLKIWHDTNGIFKVYASGRKKRKHLILFLLFSYIKMQCFCFLPCVISWSVEAVGHVWRKCWLVTTTVAFIISLIYFSGQVNMVLSHWNL